jgi:hypothetical protein
LLLVSGLGMCEVFGLLSRPRGAGHQADVTPKNTIWEPTTLVRLDPQ